MEDMEKNRDMERVKKERERLRDRGLSRE